MADEQTIVAGGKPKAGLIDFFRETRREIAKVTWPTRHEITVTTALIVVSALVVGVFFLIVDSALGYIVSKILGM
jgi:preprotein translocase subunit SecE